VRGTVPGRGPGITKNIPNLSGGYEGVIVARLCRRGAFKAVNGARSIIFFVHFLFRADGRNGCRPRHGYEDSDSKGAMLSCGRTDGLRRQG